MLTVRPPGQAPVPRVGACAALPLRLAAALQRAGCSGNAWALGRLGRLGLRLRTARSEAPAAAAPRPARLPAHSAAE